MSRRTGSYALVLPEGMGQVFSEGFFPTLIRGATAELEESDEQLVILLAGSAAAAADRAVRAGRPRGRRGARLGARPRPAARVARRHRRARGLL
ncbi:hypothetical protein ACFQ1I_08740 [Kitasatospora arboriphila]